jgi:hypothetical protein
MRRLDLHFLADENLQPSRRPMERVSFWHLPGTLAAWRTWKTPGDGGH